MTDDDFATMERDTICFPKQGTKDVMKRGDSDFQATLNSLYNPAESEALEHLIQLKTSLRTLDRDDFWTALTEGISHILGAEMSFVMKRMLVDDQDSAVEMPPLGATGSCMMAAAFHYCAHDGTKHIMKDAKFHAYGCPCAYMRHDKVFLIPDHLNDFITDNPNQLPIPAESYIAIPLSAEGKCFAHFGAMWTKESTSQRILSWAFIETLLHSLEDMILQVLLQGAPFMRSVPSAVERPRVIPYEFITASQSLRPYAGSLSHELRTPMQGIVGMLDVMYTTVSEGVETSNDPRLLETFASLKQSIEVIQDSSRRAVEAADNIVHAYDMDMSVPDAPAHLSLDDTDSVSPFVTSAVDKRPEILVAGHNLPLARSKKRRRDEAFSRHGSEPYSETKFQRVERTVNAWSRRSEPSLEIIEGIQEAEQVDASAQVGATPADLPSAEDAELAEISMHHSANRMIAPGLRHTNMREVFRFVIDEGLKVGGRPDQFLATETSSGESISVRSRGSDGTTKTKTIDWSVDPNVPHSMFIDEKDLSKLISCVFRNAIKFTDQDGGRVSIYARMSSRSKFISIKVADNGSGIPAAFLPKLFKAFSRDDYSTTRQSEGLGLGLMVAKGLARKLGGDLVCTRSDTSTDGHGSEFEIKVPVMAGETITRPTSPYSSPRLASTKPAPLHIPDTPPMPPPQVPSSPWKAPHERHEAGKQEPIHCGDLPITAPSLFHRDFTSTLREDDASQIPLSPSSKPPDSTLHRPRIRKSVSNPEIDRDLAVKYPLTFLVAEDNKINRKLLVTMLRKFGYKTIHEAHDGAEAVRQMSIPRQDRDQIDVILMDLWMPLMDGYEATERILGTGGSATSSASPGSFSPSHANGNSTTDEATNPDGSPCYRSKPLPTVLAVSADCTDGALERAAQVGMRGFMTKPYKLHDLQRLITEYCASNIVTAQG